MYADAGLTAPYAVRGELLADPSRAIQHQRILKRIIDFLVKKHLFFGDTAGAPRP